MKDKLKCGLNEAATAIGAGLMAGLAGTMAMNVSQMIEMKITKRKMGTGAASAVEKTLDIYPTPGAEKMFAGQVQWTYGTLWGMIRGLLSTCGLNCELATTVHFGAITATAMAIAPLENEPPVSEWPAKRIATSMLHHAVYAVVTGLVYDYIAGEKK